MQSAQLGYLLDKVHVHYLSRTVDSDTRYTFLAWHAGAYAHFRPAAGGAPDTITASEMCGDTYAAGYITPDTYAAAKGEQGGLAARRPAGSIPWVVRVGAASPNIVG